MTVTVVKAGPYYATGEIKFSNLRRDFRAQQRRTTFDGSETFNTDTFPIGASELLRVTDITNTDPIVPNATENSNISTSSNLKTSQFRNSIKYYYIIQSGTDLNLTINEQEWNNNLDKNINTYVFITGTCGSNSTSSPALSLNARAYNLTLDVYGSILGAGGRGGGTGGAPAISGESAGNALSVTSSGGNNIVVYVRNGSRIYGGGGGGEKGTDGSNGSGGTCYSEYTYQYCAGSPNSNCPSGGQYLGTRRPGCCRSTMRGRCVESVYQNQCRTSYSTSPGIGGAGGNGGNGQGYNLTQSSGVGGGGATCGGGCGSTCGTNGETGGSGGTWGSAGGNTSNSGSGGSSGRAITGSNYSVTGTINADTVKGLYNP